MADETTAQLDAPTTDTVEAAPAEPVETATEGLEDSKAVQTEAADNTAPKNEQKTEGQEEQKEDVDPADQPISDWSKVKLDLPEGAQVDEAVMAGFGDVAVKMGLTTKQANALAQWQLETIANQRAALMDAGTAELSKAWGSKAAANQQAVLALISRIDRLSGDDSFSKALGQSGATLFPGVVKGLLTLANMMSEDSVGGAGAAGMADHKESAYEGLEQALKEARRSK